MPIPPTPLAVSESLFSFGDHLRTWRKLHGLTGAQTADMAGVSSDTVSRLESGKSVGLESAFRIMYSLGILQNWVETAEPLNTKLGQQRAYEHLPQRVRPKASGK